MTDDFILHDVLCVPVMCTSDQEELRTGTMRWYGHRGDWQNSQ